MLLHLLLSSALAGDCDLSNGAWLLTMEPGDDPQTIFGHTALLLYDDQQGGFSPVYDYGRFELDPPLTMAWEVLTMTKPYFMGSRRLDETITRYDRLGRGITAQRLALSPEEVRQLGQRLADDLHGDSTFDYNWYRPNCTTMVLDQLDAVTDGTLRRQLAAPGASPADEVLRHSAPLWPLWLGLRWGSGRVAHQPVPRYDAAFLPDRLRTELDAVRRDGRPLVTETCVLTEVAPQPVPAEGPSRAVPLISVGGLTAATLAGSKALHPGLARLLVALLGTVTGLWGSAALLVGSLGTFAPFWGHHGLLIASPLSFGLVAGAVASWRRPAARWPMKLAALLAAGAGLALLWSLVGGMADRDEALALAAALAYAGAARALAPSAPGSTDPASLTP
jgi:hypothetical protein